MRYFVAAKNQTEFKNLENTIDSLKENAKVFAYSKDKFCFVIELFSPKALRDLKLMTQFKLEEEKTFYRK